MLLLVTVALQIVMWYAVLITKYYFVREGEQKKEIEFKYELK